MTSKTHLHPKIEAVLRRKAEETEALYKPSDDVIQKGGRVPVYDPLTQNSELKKVEERYRAGLEQVEKDARQAYADAGITVAAWKINTLG